jgi:hypothetical protein
MSPAVPRKTALSSVRNWQVVTGWHCWFMTYLSMILEIALIINPEMARMNHNCIVCAEGFIVGVYKNAVIWKKRKGLIETNGLCTVGDSKFSKKKKE